MRATTEQQAHFLGGKTGQDCGANQIFGANLLESEIPLEHVEDVRPALHGPQEPSEPYHHEPRVAGQVTTGLVGVGAGHSVRAVHFKG